MNKDITKDWSLQLGELKNGALALLAGARVLFEGARRNRRAVMASRIILGVLCLTLWTVVTFRVAQRDAERSFDAFRERFVGDFLAQQEAAERGMPVDPIEELRAQEERTVAQILYGVRDNSEKDLRTYCWCIFNRIDIKAGEFAHVESIQDAAGKAGQWMRYSEDNPVLDRLLKIAQEEIAIWRSGKSRPCDVDYTFAYWTPDRIVLLKSMNDLIHVWSY